MIQEISANEIPKPDTSELSCRMNTSPEVLYPLILGFLQSITGLNWEVRVKTVDVSDVGEFLMVKAEVNMSVQKDKIGSDPDPLIVPEPS